MKDIAQATQKLQNLYPTLNTDNETNVMNVGHNAEMQTVQKLGV